MNKVNILIAGKRSLYRTSIITVFSLFCLLLVASPLYSQTMQAQAAPPPAPPPASFVKDSLAHFWDAGSTLMPIPENIFNGTLSQLTCQQGQCTVTFYAHPSRTLLDSLNTTSTVTVGVDSLWKSNDSGGYVYLGYNLVNIQALVDSSLYSMLRTFQPGQTLFNGYFQLQAYAPGDVPGVAQPVYSWDSVQLTMMPATPYINYTLDITDFMKYWRRTGRLSDSSKAIAFTLTVMPGTSVTTASGFSASSVTLTATSTLGIGIGRKTGAVPSVPAGPPCDNRVTCFFPSAVNVMKSAVQLKWNACDSLGTLGAVQIQILRLYNTDPAKAGDPTTITAHIDWSQALTIEANSWGSATQYNIVTLAEGTGYYVWRIRHVSNWCPRLYGDARNWLPWTCTGSLVDGADVALTTGSLTSTPYLFYWTQFDDTLNWIYNRKFTYANQSGYTTDEGNIYNNDEKTTYANFLQMPIQEQEINHGIGSTSTVTQTIPDFCGRPSLKTLPAIGPVASFPSYGYPSFGYFGYQPNEVTTSGGAVYTAAAYDQQMDWGGPGSLSNPSTVGTGSPLYATYGTLAQGYPYNRTAYYNDGLNRERIIAGPGVHNITAQHAILKYYCKPMETELIHIFGDEAPSANSVLKTYTIDPNMVYNVSYTDERTGKVLATCLADPLPTVLWPVSTGSYNANDTIKKRTLASSGVPGTRIIATATYAFGKPTNLTFSYSILPKLYGDACVGICGSCDYKVYLLGKDRDDTTWDGSFVYYDSLIVRPSIDSTGGTCTASWIPMTELPYYLSTWSIAPGYYAPHHNQTLPAGTYDFALTLQLQNQDPVTHNLYVDSMVHLMHRKLDREFNGTASVLNPTKDTVWATGITATNIKNYLAGNDIIGLLSYLHADTSRPYFLLAYPCDTFMLPTAHCDAPNCATPTFAEYMVSMMKDYDTKNPPGYFNLSAGAGVEATTDAANNWFTVANNAELNAIITRMVADGYNCQSLWDAWQATVQSFIIAQVATATSLTAGPKIDWWADFMNRVGYKTLSVRPTSDLSSSTSLLRTKPYQYFPYDWGTNTSVENVFCTISGLGCTGTPPTWYSSIYNFPVSPGTQPFHIYNFFMGLKRPGSPYTGMATTLGAISPGVGKSISQMYGQMTYNCYKACEGRLDGILNTLNESANNNTIVVEGMFEPSWMPDSVMRYDLPSTYCMAYSVIKQCEAGCKLTPNSAGVVSSGQMDSFKHSLLYNIELQTGPGVRFLDGGATPSLSCDVADSFFSVPITGTRLSNDASLAWINRKMDIMRDKLNTTGTITPYTFKPFSATVTPYSLVSMSVPASPCDTNASVTISGSDLQDYMTYGFSETRLYTNTVNHTNFATIFYTVPDTVAAGTSMVPIKFKIVLNTALASTEAVRLYSYVPVLHNVVGGDQELAIVSEADAHGSYTFDTIRGPHSLHDTIEFNYYIKSIPTTAAISARNITYNATIEHWTSSGTVDDYLQMPRVTYVQDCVPMYLNRIDSSGAYHAYAVCPSASIGICPSGFLTDTFRVCMRYVHPSADTITADSSHIITCGEIMCKNFTSNLNAMMEKSHEVHESKLRILYKNRCVTPDSVQDRWINSMPVTQYEYTLYYYDRADNLIRTVSPEGVRETATDRTTTPAHGLITGYEHNTLAQTTQQTTPDGGKTTFIYDLRGKLRFSQNDKQVPGGKYSYTVYDALSRPVETGEVTKSASTSFSDTTVLDGNYPQSSTDTHTDITQTVYGTHAPSTLPVYTADGLRAGIDTQMFTANRVSYTITDKDGNLANTNDQAITLYSYDPHGNVTWQDKWVSGMTYGYIMKYTYDASSNKLNTFTFDCNKPNLQETYTQNFITSGGVMSVTNMTVPAGTAMASRYQYDFLNRMTQRYRYAMPGYINNSQNYAYTLEGWLKLINNDAAPGMLGLYGERLNYYTGDYTDGGSTLSAGYSLYNGTPTAVQEYVSTPSGAPGYKTNTLEGYTYGYDQLYRLINAQFNYKPTSGDWVNEGSYNETFSYDKNGNITALTRNANVSGTQVTMDNLTYNYPLSGGVKTSNRLNNVTDAATTTGLGNGDIHSTGTYGYDATGNVINDGATNNQYTWNPYGKLSHAMVYAGGGTLVQQVDYIYDANGNRVKSAYTSGGASSNDYYMYDASNNLVAIFNQDASGNWNAGERYFYGVGKREGMIKNGNLIYGRRRILGTGLGGTLSGTLLSTTIPATVPVSKMFSIGMGSVTASSGGMTPVGVSSSLRPDSHILEITDHLGNVRISLNADPTRTSRIENIQNYTNYYAFGGPQPGRYYNAPGYHFGFNGQEKDDALLGDGAIMKFKFREYDDRIGKFISIDPLANNYPYWTPYQFAGNTPIWARELEGKELFFGLPEIFGTTDKIVLVSEDGIEVKPAGGSAEVPKPVIDPIPGQVEPNVGPPAPDAGNPGADFGSGSEKLGKNADKFIDEEEVGTGSGNPKDINKPNPYKSMVKEGVEKAKRSFERLIREHKQKLEEFKKDPEGKTNPDLLKGKSKAVQEKIKQGRIEQLEKQIKKQEGELKKINEALKDKTQ